MAYRYKTQFYRIHVMGEGDILTEEQEWIQMSTIDNLLQASMFGCRKAFLEEGRYALEWNEAHTECWLKIRPFNSGGYSLMGLLNGRLFMSLDEISVGTLYGDATYHVYVEYENGLETDSGCFGVRAYLSRQEEWDGRMKLCVVSTHGEGSVDLDVNKVYAKNILSHTMDSTNPHGKVLSQDELRVSESLTVGGRAVHGVEYSSVMSPGFGRVVDVEFGSKPLFATVCPEELGAGEIAWSIVGNSVRITNSGRDGIRLNMRVDVQ